MTIAARVTRYLDREDIDYDVISHYQSTSSIDSAFASKIPLSQLAKAVILEDHQGHRLMAVLPADKKISFSVLNDNFNAKYDLVREPMVYRLFWDCEKGAVPPLGEPYNMMVACDELLDNLDKVYLEAGDHETLICLDKYTFQNIMSNARHLRFGKQIYH
ncbi:YbaK/EbsC family protein [Vibrio sp. S4M6]|uniref:aminoacyl-tRNA deacylase n=1 Tax=Vibrio sinus TaxID=2946865 RepID=UPI00202A3500|nr:YbaK/EbsC family protein [Vibrio sinus]MCL9783221.1 YbaK/EbsC family protein [Vibrio sinus]